jgi:hypothetical protein
MTLPEMLSQVEDPRSVHGLRYQLKDLLLMCIMAIMSGHSSYRGMGRYLENNEQDFRKIFDSYHGVPSYVQIRTVFQSIDFEKFATVFNQWAIQYISMCKGDTKSVDGKAIGATISSPHNAYQNFVSLISIFASQRGIVLHCGKIDNKKESEIPSVHYSS